MRQDTVPKTLLSFKSHHMIYIVLFDASTMKGQIHLFEVRITVRSSHFGTNIGTTTLVTFNLTHKFSFVERRRLCAARTSIISVCQLSRTAVLTWEIQINMFTQRSISWTMSSFTSTSTFPIGKLSKFSSCITLTNWLDELLKISLTILSRTDVNRNRSRWLPEMAEKISFDCGMKQFFFEIRNYAYIVKLDL